MASKKMRLDRLLVQRGLCGTRQKAQALIQAGQVLVDERPGVKAGTQVDPGVELRLRRPEHPYVSRGALKLEAALEAFEVQVRGEIALDVGASTGGFTDLLLRRGARHVFAVDVGYGQLAWSLRQDPRVSCIERCNARHLGPETLLAAPNAAADLLPPTLAVLDVSFISLTLVLPAVRAVLGPSRALVALVKPQFEAGRGQVGKGGVVRDPEVRRAAVDRVLDWAVEQGMTVAGGRDCPVAGPKGNVEYLAHLIS